MPLPAGLAAASITLMQENSKQRILPDTMQGNLYRPTLAPAVPGQRVATLETLFDFFINNVPDPDTALAEDPNFDEKLRQQPDVHACMRIRELTVASMPWRVEPSENKHVDKEAAQKVADYVEDVFREMPNVNELFRQMQNAVLMGGQGHEFVWARGGPGGPKAERPVLFYPMHKSRFVFDRLGNMALLTRATPVWGGYVSPAQGMIDGQGIFPTPPGKFMYHKYMAEGGPWYRPAAEGYVYYGRGEDTHLYIPVTFDQFVLRYRMKWLEKHGMPTTVLWYADNNEFMSQIQTIANSLRGESVVLMPKGGGADQKNAFYDLDQLEPSTGGVDAFANFYEQWTKPNIAKILLGGANILEVGEVGGYSATVDQRDGGPNMIFAWDATNIENTINSQLVPIMIRALHPNIPPTYYPKLKLMPTSYAHRMEDLETLQLAAQFVPIREQDFYDAAAVDRPKEGEPEVFLGQQQGGAEGGGMPGMPGMPGMEEGMPEADSLGEEAPPGQEQPGADGQTSADVLQTIKERKERRQNARNNGTGKGSAQSRLGLKPPRR